MMRISQLAWSWIFLVGSFVVVAGCGGSGDRPPLGDVTGAVSLNGAPLSGVIVLFKPDKGRGAAAVTNDKGAYHLEYEYRVMGTKVGPNTISFEWPIGFAGAKSLPEKYTTKSQLKEEVKSGKNTFNFDLKSDGASAPILLKNVD